MTLSSAAPFHTGVCTQSVIDEGAFRNDRSVFDGRPDMQVILPTALEIASALAYLHSNDVLHGACGGKLCRQTPLYVRALVFFLVALHHDCPAYGNVAHPMVFVAPMCFAQTVCTMPAERLVSILVLLFCDSSTLWRHRTDRRGSPASR